MALPNISSQDADPVPAETITPSLIQRVMKLPWKTIAFVSHIALYTSLTVLMLFWVDGYLAYDKAQSNPHSRNGSRLRSSDVITIVSAMTTVIGWMTNSTPQRVEMIVDDVVLVSASREQVFGFEPGTIALFDTTMTRYPFPRNSERDLSLLGTLWL